MKRIIILLVLLVGLSVSAYAQQPAEQPKSNTPEPKKILLAPDQSKALKQAFDASRTAEIEARAAQDRSAARTAEARALYLQLVVVNKVDVDKFDPVTDENGAITGWVEKVAPPKEEKTNSTNEKK